MTRWCTTWRCRRLPVRFGLDRAGLVGADGATHAGSFDLAFLGCLPGMVLMAPSDEVELVHMVATQVAIRRRPSRGALPARRGPRAGAAGARQPVPESGAAAWCGRAAPGARRWRS